MWYAVAYYLLCWCVSDTKNDEDYDFLKNKKKRISIMEILNYQVLTSVRYPD